MLEISRELKPKQLMWSDEIQQKLEKRDLTVVNRLNEKKPITKNKTIMDHAAEHVKR